MRFLILFLIFTSNIVTAQTVNDEDLRRKKVVDYLDQIYLQYETPEAEAIANLTIWAFRENLSIIKIDYNSIPESDALKLDALKLALESLLKIEVPSWEQIAVFEKQRLILVDKQSQRHSRYSNDGKILEEVKTPSDK